jgi:hypothetical protein
MEHLRERLDLVAGGSFDRDADFEPIVALIRDQGCDLEADVLPVVARLLPDLLRPLKNWGAPWLAKEIPAARDRRLMGGDLRDQDQAKGANAPDVGVAPDPPTRDSKNDPRNSVPWDDFVAGYREGLIEWNRARLGPCPGEPGCRAPTEVLREHGFRS